MKLLIGAVILVLTLLLLTCRSLVLPFAPLLTVGFGCFVAGDPLAQVTTALGDTRSGQATSLMVILMISRYRKELRRDKDHRLARATALAETWEAIAASSLTVKLVALTLAFANHGDYTSVPPVLGLGMFVTLIAALTLMPALLEKHFPNGSLAPTTVLIEAPQATPKFVTRMVVGAHSRSPGVQTALPTDTANDSKLLNFQVILKVLVGVHAGDHPVHLGHPALVEVVHGLDLTRVRRQQLHRRAGLVRHLARLGELDFFHAIGGQDGDPLAVELLGHTTKPPAVGVVTPLGRSPAGRRLTERETNGAVGAHAPTA